MKALVKFKKGLDGLGIQDVPVPEPKEGEVLIQVKACGICGSDIHSMTDERETNMPVILGHEFVGIVSKTNGESNGLKAGDWVTGLPAAYSCGECLHCLRGDTSLCAKRGSIGTHVNGAMAEYLVMPADFCYKVPDHVENKMAFVAAEPLACTVRGVYEKLDVKPGDVAVVSGPGTIGLFTLQALKSRGATVIVSGLPSDKERLDKALELGADAAVDSYEKLEKEVRLRNVEGADIACEASGVTPSIQTCLDITKIHGQILQLGVVWKNVSVFWDQILLKELVVMGTNSSDKSTWDITMKLIADGKVDPAPLISKSVSLDNWKEGFQSVIDKNAYKVIVTP